LLRFLETKQLEHIGSRKGVKIDVRILTATNNDLEEAVAKGGFRSDLYHRIKVFPLRLPPLRERAEDKILLAQYFLKKIRMERDWSCRGFTAEALDAIRKHPWPGNVREMINRIRRAVVVQDEYISPEDLELNHLGNNGRKSKLREANTDLKEKMIRSALQEHHYNISQTAKALGISRPYLHLLIKKMDISVRVSEERVSRRRLEG
jgi:two-component system NtrC family response regulator